MSLKTAAARLGALNADGHLAVTQELLALHPGVRELSRQGSSRAQGFVPAGTPAGS